MSNFNSAWPKISVIIPATKEKFARKAIAALKRVDYPPNRLEVFLSLGLSPSRQRNLAGRKAKGEFFYFLDNDSRISRKAFKRLAAVLAGNRKSKKAPGLSPLLPLRASTQLVDRFFANPINNSPIAVVGGPSLWGKDKSLMEKLNNALLESFFSHFKMSTRYRPVGQIRQAGEQELILCNMAVERQVFLSQKGFREDLYPNEENEFLNRIKKKGWQIIYHPHLSVNRPRPNNFFSLLKKVNRYGRGRMEQIRLEGWRHNLVFFLPLLLLLYLLILPFASNWWLFLPLAFYWVAGLISSLGFALDKKSAGLFFLLPIAYMLFHIAYALGLIWGLGTNLRRRRKQNIRAKIVIKKIKSFNHPWS